MVTLPTSIVTINTNGKIFKLEVHNWCQEIILRNKDGKCLAFSDGSKKSMTDLVKFFDGGDHDSICLIIFNLCDDEMRNRFLTFWSKPYEI
ncbi:hypothetical protein ABNavy97_193 [Acinetobacter phage AB-Navy97]|nr:hypothetical protein ABNavy97_193 [Acinetobacter phage AB-Navy97]